MKIAFWNVCKKENLDELIINLLLEYNIDIMGLAEYTGDIKKLCERVNDLDFRYLPLDATAVGCDMITGLYNSGYSQCSLFARDRYYITSFETTCFNLLLALIHAPSNLYSSDSDRRIYFSEFYKDIENCEKLSSISNSVVLGDLNSNPYEDSIISAGALHSIPYKEEAIKEKRTVNGVQYNTFYNPSWRLLFQNKPPYGTYYYSSSKYLNRFWNVFDQVIIRPCLIDAFVDDSLFIVSKIKDVSLLKAGYKPNKKTYSDHLPIVFELKEEKIR